jgi:endonuclease/exonuclease/phosphatase family metal-dependent hydrolase
LENFGNKKSPEVIDFMAKVLRGTDIVAAQEINAGGNFGAQAVAKLAASLSRTGADWDYIVSDKTMPENTEVERYAYLFRKSTVTINRDGAHLLKELEEAISREPFALSFHLKDGKKSKDVQVFTIHAVPTNKHPIEEVEKLPLSKEVTMNRPSIFSGDFNLAKPATDPTFVGMGYSGNISDKTSIGNKVISKRGYMTKQYDNIYTKQVKVCAAGVIDFVARAFSPVDTKKLSSVKLVSDHLPVYIAFDIE